MSTLEVTYRRLARPWQPDELAERYHAAYARGASDLPPGDQPSDRPVTLLATSVPRLISLAVTANVLHVLPPATSGSPVAEALLSTLDITASGSVHRCHLALEAIGSLDQDAPSAPQAISDCLTHLLVVCVFAETAADR